jgi:hypothetical protein
MRRGEMSIELISLHWVVFRGIISTSDEGSGVVENEKRYLESYIIYDPYSYFARLRFISNSLSDSSHRPRV